MKLLKTLVVCATLAIVIVGVGLASLRTLTISAQHKREQSYVRDRRLDRAFEERARAPLEVRVMISTRHGSYQMLADQPSMHSHVSELGKVPAILVLTGCGFPVWGRDVPPNVAVLSVHENPNLLGRKTLVEGCISHDGRGVRRAISEELAHLASYAESADWIDNSRLMIIGHGEAAPVVAAYTGPAKQRITWADPCLVPWADLSQATRLTMLLSATPQGLTPATKVHRQGNQRLPMPPAGPPTAAYCEGLPRPNFDTSTRVLIAPGNIKALDRPAKLMAAQKVAYDAL